MERAVAQLILILLVAPFGDVAVAAYSLTRRVEMFAHMGASGFGMASGVIVGQSLGAGKPERAKETIRKSLVFASLINAVLTVIIVAFPVLFLSLFTRDEAFLEVARKWVIIAAAGYVLLGMSQVFQQSLQTAGDTMTVMLITLGAMWGVEIPLAYFLTHSTDLGQFGVAWAMLASIAIRPVIFGPYFLSGRWLNARVFG
jgi:Na+-driven multidrug efflux pump